MEFCKAFNAQTQKVEPGLPLPVVITAYADKSFTFIIKTPPATVLIKKAAGIEKGSPSPHTDKVGKITRKQVEEIAKAKMPDLTAARPGCRRCARSPAARAPWASSWRACKWPTRSPSAGRRSPARSTAPSPIRR